ncbi:MAG: T9SS type A sorting domain-containing protein [Bacteroidales bacterium]|nr:T9SS type A sorting domain-containing protein [Bacteroidales bacterium]
MRNNSNFQNQLMIIKKYHQFLAIVIVSIATSCTVFAQNNFIVCGIPNLNRDTFNDIPDTTIQSNGDPYYGDPYNRYNFDMDGNGETDVKIRTFSLEGLGGHSDETELRYLANNIKFALGEQMVDTDYYYNPPVVYYYNFPKKFNYNDTIDERYNFVHTNMYLSYISGSWGNPTTFPGWLFHGEKYIGISMEKNDVTLYGYILVQVTGYSTVIIKEFAMNINPYIGIVPGATEQVFELYPNPAKNEVFIKLNGENAGKPARFTLYDLSGKKLVQVADIPQNGHIALPEFAKGLYIAEIEVEGQREIRKLQIE